MDINLAALTNHSASPAGRPAYVVDETTYYARHGLTAIDWRIPAGVDRVLKALRLAMAAARRELAATAVVPSRNNA